VRWLVALIVVAWLAPAWADDRPWARGISAAEQKTALALYDAGNKHFEESEYKEALAQYEEALKHWPHPAVYFNAAVCLYHLDQDVKAADYIDKALAYGDAPFDKKTFDQAKDYKALLASRVTELEVTCKQTDVKITLDGEVLMDHCPASATRKLKVQQDHAIVGEKPGYETEKIGPIRLAAGEKKTIEIVLKSAAKGKLVRRWSKALPWYVMGAGGAIALVGVAPLLWGRHNQDLYEADIAKACVMGCAADNHDLVTFQPLHDRAVHEADVATGAFVAGGALVSVGIAMVVLNQPHLEKAPVVAPSVGPDHAGVIVFGSW
jgi:hypothetical protein